VPWFWNGSAAEPVDVPGAAQVWLETDITGPAALDVQWFNPVHTIAVNGRPLVAAAVDPVNGPANPGRFINGTLLLPAGVSTVRWQGAYEVPPVVLRPLSAAFAVGAGPPDAPLYMIRGSWAADAADGVPAAPSLRSASPGALWLPVEGPGTLRFAWKSSRALALAGAYCHLDGVRVLSAAPGTMPWQEASVTVPAGWHRVQWVSASASTAAVDDIRWEPAGAFAAWAAAQLPRWTDRSPDLDPDGDGLANFMEFALGRPPLTPHPLQPALTPLPDMATGAGITFPRAAVPPKQAVLSVEVSADLSTWTAADPATLTLSGSFQMLRLTPPWRYARLRAAAP
jgi:hypothetical protein